MPEIVVYPLPYGLGSDCSSEKASRERNEEDFQSISKFIANFVYEKLLKFSLITLADNLLYYLVCLLVMSKQPN